MPWQKMLPSNLVCLSPHPTLPPHLSPSDPPPLPSSAALHPTPPPFPDALLDPEYPTSEDEPDAPSPPPARVPSPRTPPPHPLLSNPHRQLIIYIASCAHPQAPWTAQSAHLHIPSAHIHPVSPQRSSPIVEICHVLQAIEHDPAASLTDRLLGDYQSLLLFASVINLRVDQLEPLQSGYKTIGTVVYAHTAHTHVPALTGEAIPPHLDPLTRLQSVCIALYLEPRNAQVSDDGARYLPTFEPSPQAPDPRPLKRACHGTPPLSLPEHSALVTLLASMRPEVQMALAAAVHKDEYSQPENTVAAYCAVSQGHVAYEVCHNLDSRVAVGPFGVHLHWDDKTWQNKNRTLMCAIEVTEMEFSLSFASAEEVEIHTGLKYWVCVMRELDIPPPRPPLNFAYQDNLLPGEAWCHRNASETKLKRVLVMLHEFKIRVMNVHHCP
ncbi:hypothetical protein K439DRAFT_1623397 [Ramaria rubella]|nr:hypothetical protein K439DRAFT_1623397 [Ramaria rubella]